jgi:hypothetical protein
LFRKKSRFFHICFEIKIKLSFSFPIQYQTAIKFNKMNAEQQQQQQDKSTRVFFDEDEDKRICDAWSHVSQDADTGNSQKAKKFWTRIFDRFVASYEEDGLLVNPKNRDESSLNNRFNIIKATVAKFCGCLANVLRLNQSGMSEEDKVYKQR